jgi:hypothetical protein
VARRREGTVAGRVGLLVLRKKAVRRATTSSA